MSNSHKKVFADILLDLVKLREVRKNSSDYLESCDRIVSKLEATLSDVSDGDVVFDKDDKMMLEEIYGQITAEETYANASSDLRDISNLNRLLNDD